MLEKAKENVTGNVVKLINTCHIATLAQMQKLSNFVTETHSTEDHKTGNWFQK